MTKELPLTLFDPNQTDFETDYQRLVWRSGISIVPPEVSLAGVTDPDTREGCMQVYLCTMELLEDMFKQPDAYAPFPVGWYTDAFFAWLLHGNAMVKQRECFERFLEIIPQFGFSYDKGTNTLANERYPLFPVYFDRLRILAKEKKQNLGGYLPRRDFRLFAQRVVITLDDLLRPAPDQYKAYLKELHAYALSKGAKWERKGPTCFRYAYQGHYILVLQNNPAHVEVPYSLSDGGFERFLAEAQHQPDADALVAYIQKDIGICDGCRYRSEGRKPLRERCGRWVEIRGVRRFASGCHPAISKYHRGKDHYVYTYEDIRLLKRMMDLRISQIDHFIA